MQTFMMGEYAATLPEDRLFVANHMYALPIDESFESVLDSPQTKRTLRFGLTSYAVRLLQDVYFLEFENDPPVDLAQRQQIGSIESKKAESDLYSPVAGRMLRINTQLLDDPSLINADTYGEGWMMEIETTDTSQLLDLAGYLEHLEQAWVVAQRTIKGQMA
ncbi:MAG: glycine cleavage system protein H [Planctomycetota bacterium]